MPTGPSFVNQAGLPAALTPLVGRADELAAIAALVQQPEVRLVTMTGPGGVGKTRLALAVAASVAGDFPDGVRFVSLAALADPTLLAPTIAQSLGLAPAAETSPEAQLAWFLRDRSMLLVLDNFEQIVEAAPLATDVLGACPRLKILVTSRARLRVSGEHEHVVPPLARSAPEASSTGEPGESEAVQLFVARAQAARDDFVLADANAATVAAICDRLEGLPLAIELAAARTKALPPAALLARLDRRLPLLTGGNRDAPARQRTMRDTIAWSYDLLSPSEQALFRRLAVFVGGFTLDAAAAAAVASANSESENDLLDRVTALVEQSLLLRSVRANDEPRFAMLETLREFGLERLAASGEATALGRLHAAWFLDVAERAAAGLELVADADVLDQLEVDLGNLRAALRWLIDHGDADASLRLAVAIEPLWFTYGPVSEGRRWLTEALAIPGAAERLRAGALFAATWLAFEQADLVPARALAEEAIATFGALGDAVGAARAQWLLGSIVFDLGDRPLGETLLTDALATFRAAGDPLWIGRGLNDLGVLALQQGEVDRAAPLLEEALALLRESGATNTSVFTLQALGSVERERGNRAEAAARFHESLALAAAQGSQRAIASNLEGLGALVADSQSARAARLLAAARQLRTTIAVPLPVSEQAAYDDSVTRARAATEPATFAAAWAEGAAMPLAQAIAEAAAVAEACLASDATPLARAAAPAHGLSPRELDVVRLLADGRSNQEIADTLFISHRTATTHVRNILAKLNLDSRTAIAAWAIRHGLA